MLSPHTLPLIPQTPALQEGLLLLSPVLLAGRVRSLTWLGTFSTVVKAQVVQLRYFSYAGLQVRDAVAEATITCDFKK